jgi:hypothetical protein
MARPRNPLSLRNRNESFKGAELQRFVEREAQKLAKSKRAQPVREGREFDLGELRSIVKAPFTPAAAHSWSIDQIVSARDQQMTGRFRLPARLAESFGTDDALFTARGVRLAPVQSLSVKIEAGKGPKGDKQADEAEALFGTRGVAISSETVTTIRSHLADHGVAFGAVSWQARADGSRIDPILTAWPIEFVWWDPTHGCYMTQVRRLECDEDLSPGGIFMPSPATIGMPIERIVHGDGRWVVFSKSELLPHRLDAALLPAALVWARHAFAMRDFAKGSAAHGNAKVVGELPPETPLTDAEGRITREAEAFLTLVQAVASQDSPAGIRPSGSKIDYTVNSSQAWEVWAKLAELSEKAAARIYLGTDGILGAQGGSPGVDISQLLGVATSKIQSDLACIERALQTGLISPWAAINWGDDTRAPTRTYAFPDPDEAENCKSFAERNGAFLDEIAKYKAAGFVLDQAFVDRVAKEHKVPAPTLPVATTAPPSGDVSPDAAASDQAH